MTRAWWTLVVSLAACGSVSDPVDVEPGTGTIGIGTSHDPVWLTQLGGPGEDEAITIATAPSGVYIGGHTAGSLFGAFTDPCDAGGEHSGEDCADSFIMNVTSGDGVQFGGRQSDEVKFLAITADAVYAAGNEREGAGGNYQKDAFVTRFPLDLSAAAWTVNVRNQGRVDEFMGVASHAGDVFAAGGSNFAVDGHPIEQEDGIVTRITAGGATEALDQFGGRGLDELMGIAADASGAYTIGASADWIDDDPGRNLGSTDVILVAHDRSLEVSAERCRVEFGTKGKDVGQSVITIGDYIYVAGYTEGRINGDLPNGARCNLDGSSPDDAHVDAFIAKYDMQCQHVWTRQFGSRDSDAASTIASDGRRLYVTGFYGSGAEAHGGTTGAHGFVRAYDLDGNVLGEILFDSSAPGSVTTDIGQAVAVDADFVYVTGGTDGVLGAGNLGGKDIFVAKIPHTALDGTVTVSGDGCPP